MMKQLLIIASLACYLQSRAQQQPDTIIVFDIASQSTSTILPVAFSSTVVADNTSWFVGNMGNQFPLSTTPPNTNLFAGSNYSDLAHATDFFNLTDFPVRTAVALRSYINGTLSPRCSGMIVGPCAVLTSGACVYDFINKNFSGYDSILVAPAYNNGAMQPNLPYTTVKRVYVFKTFYSQSNWDDVALLELNAPIGLQTGWTGFGFNNAAGFPGTNVFHKFSYPSAPQPNDTTKVYNGDTLYYNYGYINQLGSTVYGINSNAAGAIPGQGGSTFMFTDNTSQFVSVGLSSFSNNYYHYKINNAAFYQLQNVMGQMGCASGTVTGIINNSVTTINMGIYPNPFNNEATVQFDYQPGQKYTLSITNSLGQQVKTQNNINSGKITLAREELSAGIYLLHLQSSSGAASKRKLVIQ